jgi:hypothetical protein
MLWQEFLKKYHERSRKDFQYYDTQHQAWGILGAVDFTWGLVAVEIDDVTRHDYISVYDLIDPSDKPVSFAVRCETTGNVSFDEVTIPLTPDGIYEVGVEAEVPEFTPPYYEEGKVDVFRNGLLIQFENLWIKRHDESAPTKHKSILRFPCKGVDLMDKDLTGYTYEDFLNLAGRGR